MESRFWRSLWTCLAVAFCGCRTASDVRSAAAFSAPMVMRAQDGEFCLGILEPIGPESLINIPEIAPLAIDRQLLPFEDRSVTLMEAIETAVSQSDVVRVLSGGSVQVNSATTYDPAIQKAQKDATFAIFDPRYTAGYVGSRIAEPPSSFFGPGLTQPTRRDEGDFIASLSKLWQTGGTTTVAYAPPLGYLFVPPAFASGFNPIFSSALVFEARQPLLRGAGFEVNRAPLRIAQLRQEQSVWDFQQALLAQIRSVEEAYWDLQASYIALEAIDTVIPLAAESVRIEKARQSIELAIDADVARAETQLALFRQQRVRAEGLTRQKEYQLRNVIGLPPVDAYRIVPHDPPVRSAPELNPDAVAVAVENRPEIVQARLGLRIREIEYRVAENGKLPQLDLRALYRANGVGQSLDSALAQTGSFAYTDWTLGITWSMAIGNRAPRANLRAAEWQLTRERAMLQQTVRNVAFRIADVVRDVQIAWNEYELASQRAKETQIWLKTARIRFSDPPPDSQNADGLLLLLYDYQAALRSYVDATTESSLILARYNGLLARFEEAQGTLLNVRGVEIADDPRADIRRHKVPLYVKLLSHHGYGTFSEGRVMPVMRQTQPPPASPAEWGPPTNPVEWELLPEAVTPEPIPVQEPVVNPAAGYRTPGTNPRINALNGWTPPPIEQVGGRRE